MFAQFSNKILSTYVKDNTSKLEVAMEEILHRDKSLTQHISSKMEGNSSLTTKATETSFCKKLSLFLEGLAIVERDIKEYEQEISSISQNSSMFREKLIEIKEMIAAKDAEFSALKQDEEQNNSKHYVQAHKLKIEKITLRWKNVQNKVLGFAIQHQNEDTCNEDQTSEKENINPSLAVLFSEYELWIREKKKELGLMTIAGDSCTIVKQIDSQKSLKADIEARILEVEKKFDRNGKEQDGNPKHDNDDKRREKLLGAFRSLQKAVDHWGIKLYDNHMKISIFETSMTNLDYKLNQISSDSSKTQKTDNYFAYTDDLPSLEEDMSNLLSQEQALQVVLSPQNIVSFESLKDRVNNVTTNTCNEPETYCLPNGWERGIQDEIPYFINLFITLQLGKRS